MLVMSRGMASRRLFKRKSTQAVGPSTKFMTRPIGGYDFPKTHDRCPRCSVVSCRDAIEASSRHVRIARCILWFVPASDWLLGVGARRAVVCRAFFGDQHRGGA